MKTIKISRKIVSTKLQIKELKKWLGKEVDIIIVEKKPVKQPSDSFDAAGRLTGYKNKNLIDQEERGWGIAVREKHGTS